MSANDLPIDTEALIAHILERFHETHRRELPGLIAQAQAVSAPLGGMLAALAEGLEQHLFKEEMRLFPMMEQGGSSLIVHLIDDMQAEHERQQQELLELQALIDGEAIAARAPALQQGLAKLLADLREHMRVEDEVLFPRFRPAVG